MISVVGKDAAAVLKSPDFDVVQFAGYYQDLSNRLGVDFSALIRTAQIVPLALSGTDHAEQRADMARLIAEGRQAANAALPGIVADCYGCLASPGAHEIVASCIVPSVDRLMQVYVGFDTGLGPGALVSQIFNRKNGVAKRCRMNTEIANLTARIDAAFPNDTDRRRASRLGLVILGRDATIGTLGLSLMSSFADPAGNLPVPPNQSSVQNVERRAQNDVDIAGHCIAKGDIVRCRLQSGDPDMNRVTFFGAGPHMCVGRVVALDMFQVLAAFLKDLPGKRRVIAAKVRECDVFTVPETITVQVE